MKTMVGKLVKETVTAGVNVEAREGKDEVIHARITKAGVKEWLFAASTVAAGSATGAAVTSLLSYAVDRGVDGAAGALAGGVAAGGAFGF